MKPRRSAHVVARLAVQAVFFIFAPASFSVAFNGVKYIAGQIGKHEMIVWNPFLATLVALLAFTALFDRFFCGYACAFGSFGDWLFACAAFFRKKAGAKAPRLPERAVPALLCLKYIVLAGIVAAVALGAYPTVGQADPWGLFASFRAGDFALSGRIWAAVALGSVMVGMAFVERFFCMLLCPLGAVFALLPMLPPMIYDRRKEECIPGCALCTKACPASISLGEKDSKHGECFQCGKCGAICPKGNMRLGFRKLKGTETWLIALKAAALFAICYRFLNV